MSAPSSAFSLSAARAKIKPGVPAPKKPVVPTDEEELPPPRTSKVKVPAAAASTEEDDAFLQVLNAYEEPSKPKKGVPPTGKPGVKIAKAPVRVPSPEPEPEQQEEEEEVGETEAQEAEEEVEEAAPETMQDEEEQAAQDPNPMEAPTDEEIAEQNRLEEERLAALLAAKTASKSKVKLPQTNGAPKPTSVSSTIVTAPPKGPSVPAPAPSSSSALEDDHVGTIVPKGPTTDGARSAPSAPGLDRKEPKKTKMQSLGENASAEDMYDAFLQDDDVDIIDMARIRKLDLNPVQLTEMRAKTLRDLDKLAKKKASTYFGNFKFIPPEIQACKNLTEYLQGNDLGWKGISIQFLIAPESKEGFGKYGSKNCLYLIPRLAANRAPATISDERLPVLFMNTGPQWIQNATAFAWGTYKDKAREKRTKAFQEAAFSNFRKAYHEIMFSTQMYEHVGYAKEVQVIQDDGKPKTEIRNRESMRWCSTNKYIEYAALRFLIGSYIEANEDKKGNVVPEGKVLHSTSPLHQAINDVLNQEFQEMKTLKPGTLTCWKDLLRLDHFLTLLDKFVYKVARSSAFGSGIIRANKDARGAYMWTLDEKEFEQHAAIFSAKLKVMRHRGKDEKPNAYICAHPKLLSFFYLPDKDPAKPPPDNDLGGTVYQYPKIANIHGDEIDPMHFDTKEARGARLMSGMIGHHGLGIKFMTNTSKRCHLSYKWYGSDIMMDSLVTSTDMGAENRELGLTFEARELIQTQEPQLLLMQEIYEKQGKDTFYDPEQASAGQLEIVTDVNVKRQLQLSAKEMGGHLMITDGGATAAAPSK